MSNRMRNNVQSLYFSTYLSEQLKYCLSNIPTVEFLRNITYLLGRQGCFLKFGAHICEVVLHSLMKCPTRMWQNRSLWPESTQSYSKTCAMAQKLNVSNRLYILLFSILTYWNYWLHPPTTKRKREKEKDLKVNNLLILCHLLML
jgi:hypothetical protein